MQSWIRMRASFWARTAMRRFRSWVSRLLLLLKLAMRYGAAGWSCIRVLLLFE